MSAIDVDTFEAGPSGFDAMGGGPGFGHLGVLMDIRRVLLPADSIAGVLVDPKIDPVPGAGAWLLGVVNHRNAAISVLDLQALVVTSQRDGPVRYVVLLRGKQFLYGVACAEVYGFESTSNEGFEVAQTTGDRRWTDEFSSKIVPSAGGEAWCLLDPARVERQVEARIEAQARATTSNDASASHKS